MKKGRKAYGVYSICTETVLSVNQSRGIWYECAGVRIISRSWWCPSGPGDGDGDGAMEKRGIECCVLGSKAMKEQSRRVERKCGNLEP